MKNKYFFYALNQAKSSLLKFYLKNFVKKYCSIKLYSRFVRSIRRNQIKKP